MKKEKQVKTYQRRTKSGKMVTVKAHTAKYDAAEKTKEMAKKKGAGDELEEKKKAKSDSLIIDDALLKAYADSYDDAELEYIDVFDKNGRQVESTKKNMLAELRNTAKQHPDKIKDWLNPEHLNRAKESLSKSKGGTRVAEKVESKELPKEKTGKAKKMSYAEIDSYKGDPRNLSSSERRAWTILHGYHQSSDEKKLRAQKSLKGLWEYIDGKDKGNKKASPKKETKQASSEPAFTAAEFKEWYQGTGSAADKKVAKALRAQLGRSGYRKFEDEAIDNYTPRGHSAMFKKLSSMGGDI